MSPPLLAIRDLVRDYAGRPPQRALDGVSLTVAAGSIVGVVGESGCGKSTLARLAAALDRPTAGQVLLDGEDLHALPARLLARRRGDVQMVFQDPYGSLDPRWRVDRIVAEPLHALAERPGRAERDARVAEVLAAVGLTREDGRRFPHAFSGGQRQRIAIARALVTRPKLVIADEAVSALDLSVQAQVLNLILDLRDRDGIAVLFITHNLGAVDAVCDRVAVMYLGRIVETGPMPAVFDRPLHPYTRRLLDAEPRLDAAAARPPGPAIAPVEQFRLSRSRPRDSEPMKPLPVSSWSEFAGGESALAGDPASWDGCAFRPRCPLAVDRCRGEPPPLRGLPGAPDRLVACHRADAMAALPIPRTPRPGSA